MNALEKHASKKTISKRLAEALYGVKPNRAKSYGDVLGAAGGLTGGIAGGTYGRRGGEAMARKLIGMPRPAGEATAKDMLKAILGDTTKQTGRLLGANYGGFAGLKGGEALGRAIGKRLDKKEMAKYLARKRKVNKGLAAGGGAAGLAALVSVGKKKTSAAKSDPRLARAGVSGYNKPKRTPGHPTKSHIVVAKEGDRVKTIRFGQQGVKTNQTAGQRKAFKSRHQKNIAKGKMSAAYWANRAKWSPSKTKDKKNQKWVKGTKTASAWVKLASWQELKI